MRSSSLRGMDSQTEKYKYNIVDFNDCVIILTVFYVYFGISYINVLIDGMNKNENENEKIIQSDRPKNILVLKLNYEKHFSVTSFRCLSNALFLNSCCCHQTS
jgi:hypothetical protein